MSGVFEVFVNLTQVLAGNPNFWGDFSGVFAKMTCGRYGFCPCFFAKKGKHACLFHFFARLFVPLCLVFPTFHVKKEQIQ